MAGVLQYGERREMREFLSVAECVCAENPRYMPDPEYWVRRMLSRRANPSYRSADRELVVVRRAGRPSARAALVFPRDTPEEALFGFVESTRDRAAFECLVGELEQRCRLRGVQRLLGPFSPNTQGITGLQMDAYDTPRAFFEAGNPDYYPGLFLAHGFTVVKTGRAWKVDRPVQRAPFPSMESGGYRVRSLAAAHPRDALRAISAVHTLAFQENWYAHPLSPRDYRFLGLSLLPALSRRLVLWVELDGMPIGIAVALLDIQPVLGRTTPATLAGACARVWRQRHRVTGATVLVIGMIPAHRHSRGGHLLYQHTVSALAPFRSLATSWITEGNRPSEALAAHLGMRPYKTFAVMQKTID